MSTFRAYLLSILSAVVMSVAWWFPGSSSCAVLGWLSTLLLVAAVRSPALSYGSISVYGFITNCLGFYWLFATIKGFGGFDYFAASLIFLLFVVASANQQLIFLFLYRRLPGFFSKSALGIACAWLTAELISVRIFPWSLGHTQLAFLPLTQIVDVLGTPTLAFLMLWSSEAAWRLIVEKERRRILAAPFVVLAACLIYGAERVSHFSTPLADKVAVTLIQANISVAEKHNIKYFERNKERYVELSTAAAKPNSLVIWPESVITDFIFDGVNSVTQDRRLPFLGDNVGLLVGALTYRSQSEIFNSALAILPDGKIAQPYHKRILMPFGEFTPFASTFPWLKEINATAGEFTPGSAVSIFDYRFDDPARKAAKVSPLICYEDIVPSLGRAATEAGANVLVNITNDAWFGDSVAPYQHHLIAAFRAVENRRFLVRSTNSGLTAIVDPLGQTVAQLKPFSDGVLNYDVGLPQERSLYTSLFGDALWWALSALVCLCGLLKLPSFRQKDHVSASRKNV
ncbi:MAG: apolipoprotein N-acyltransferase [Deltaproteobacteria bacterium]|nr:apolipoprotein N-acyltransferase [Deltaproteobacteria bacterium]